MTEEEKKEPLSQEGDKENIDTKERAKERLEITEEKRNNLEEERNDLQERLARALAESENMRKRTEREKQDTLRYGGSDLARDFVNSLDNLERALGAIPEPLRKTHEEVNALFTGLEMSVKEFQSTLERHHIQRFVPMGEVFSHDYHQAVGEQPHDSIKQGAVAQVLQAGYILHDRLLRPAMVMVSTGPLKSKEDKGKKTNIKA